MITGQFDLVGGVWNWGYVCGGFVTVHAFYLVNPSQLLPADSL